VELLDQFEQPCRGVRIRERHAISGGDVLVAELRHPQLVGGTSESLEALVSEARGPHRSAKADIDEEGPLKAPLLLG
jgi:hypothetical protein